MNFDRAKSMIVGTPIQPAVERLRMLLSPARHPAARLGREESALMGPLLSRLLARTSNGVDIGGHLGSFLAEIVRRAPEGRHFAFEPIPVKARWLARKFPAVDVRAVALGDRSGTSPFTYIENRSGYSGLTSRADGPNDRAIQLEVEVARLDDVLPADYRADLIKVDVEGGELDVFRGAVRTLSAGRSHVLFECLAGSCRLYGYGPDDLFDLLSGRCGLEIFRLGDWLGGGRPMDREAFHAATNPPDDRAPAGFNFLAAPARSPLA